MITLNLIPPEQKTLLKNTRLYATCKEVVTLLFLFAAIVSIMFWISRFYLENDLADLITVNAVNIKSNEATNARIIAINQKITLVDSISKNFIPSRRIIEIVAQTIPENIALNAITFYRQQSIIEISGIAKTRNDLLGFKNTLSTATWVKNIDLPMTSLISKDNNQFNIKLEVNLEKL